MSENVKRALGSIVRTLLLIVSAYLIRHKIGDSNLFGPAIDDLTALMVGWIGVFGTLTWSLWEKSNFGKKLAVAIALPPVVNGQPVTEADVSKVLKATSPGSVPTPAEAAAILKP